LNPANAVLHAGHLNGTVTLWSPASSKYLAKILCHKGAAVLSLAMDPTGQTMVTGGADRKVRIWDLRMLQERFSYYCAAGTPTAMDISQTGLLGIAHAGHATVWSAASLQIKARDPYMHHAMPGCAPVETLCFRPFEDVCGIGHAKGISSIVIPGSGEPNLDTSEYQTNPMQDAKQRQEAEVRALLDKLQPDMIGLDADQVGGVEESDPHKRQERIKDLEEEANAKQLQGKKQKVKKRGRSKIQTKLRRKKQNIIDQSVLKQRDAKERAVKMAESSGTAATDASESIKERAPTALKRFF
jgi:U3 small nucleolar RNA-associated protein 7